MTNTLLTTKTLYNDIISLYRRFESIDKAFRFTQELLTSETYWHTKSKKELRQNGNNSFIYKLKDAGIIIARKNEKNKETYSVDGGKAKQYKLKSKYKNSALIKIYKDKITNKNNHKVYTYTIFSSSYNNNISNCIYHNVARFGVNVSNQVVINTQNKETTTMNVIKELKIDFEKLKAVKEKSLLNLQNKIKQIDFAKEKKKLYKVKYFSWNNLYDEYEFSERFYFIKPENIGNRLLYKFKENYYLISLVDEIDFINYIISDYRFAWEITIAKLEIGQIRASINSTNGRLDHNLTNMPSELADEIFRQNDMVQFDLSNSQFAILSHIAPTIDTKFKELAQNGGLYEYIQEQLNIEDRKDAKKMMFELFFSKNKSFASTKNKLKKIFPKTVDYITNYKKENKYNEFAIMLQKFESNLFIVTILDKIYSKNIIALSKHDSIICYKKDSEKVNKIIKEEFKKINFKGKIKIK